MDSIFLPWIAFFLERRDQGGVEDGGEGAGEHLSVEVTMRYTSRSQCATPVGRDQSGVQKGGQRAGEHLGVEVLRDHVRVFEGGHLRARI